VRKPFVLLLAGFLACGRTDTSQDSPQVLVVPDGGLVRDAGAPLDAGAPFDAGTPFDAGVPFDAGAPVDAGLPFDAGTAFDAGPCLAPRCLVLTDAGTATVISPPGVSAMRIRAWGGGGAGGNQRGARGGGGAFVSVLVETIAPGQPFLVSVGEGGRSQGDGAGASSVRAGRNVLVLSAGGGGGGSDGSGGASYTGGAGGAGGLTAGEPGQPPVPLGSSAAYCVTAGGQGATASAGGMGGMASSQLEPSLVCAGESGSSLRGGTSRGSRSNCERGTGAADWIAGGGQPNGGGGGGGSGVYGGGGGGLVWTYCGAGGGGGSSVVGNVLRAAPGTGPTPGNAAESFGAGVGGPDNLGTFAPTSAYAGRDGRVEIRFE
jgi:hypothetical protein